MLRAIATAAVVAGIVGLGVAALVDALRAGGRTPADRSAAPGVPQARPAELAAAGARGVLYYSDGDERCVVRALRLPSLHYAPAPDPPGCALGLSPDLSWNLAGAVWHPTGELAARCRSGRVVVTDPAGFPPVSEYRGCSPSWAPDGSLTLVRDGGVVRCGTAGRCSVLLSERALGGEARQIAWLAEGRLAVGTTEGVLVVERGVPDLRSYTRQVELDASPRGRYFVLRGERSLEILRADPSDRPMTIPESLTTAHAVAWSPDERWLAVATRASVYLLRTDDSRPRLFRVPVVARDLAWR